MLIFFKHGFLIFYVREIVFVYYLLNSELFYNFYLLLNIHSSNDSIFSDGFANTLIYLDYSKCDKQY